MCGRFTLITDIDSLQQRFSFQNGELTYQPRYNIAPTQPVLTVVHRGVNQDEFMRWGLIPSWAKDISVGARMINARSETVAEKPSFRRALQQRRCLVLADGFYEWQGKGKAKISMYIALKTGHSFAMAGLWETWRDPLGEVIRSCTIITTAANEVLEPIHHRMPVILEEDQEAVWLDPDLTDADRLTGLLKPYPPDMVQAHRVSTLVNTPRNDSPQCLAPVDTLLPESGTA